METVQKTILMVDDSAFARSNIRRALDGQGYIILEASSGEQALQVAAENHFDLATLDLLMPGLNGMETMQRLRVTHPQARFVIITADIQTPTRQEMLDAGADMFLNKPVIGADLRAALTRLLG